MEINYYIAMYLKKGIVVGRKQPLRDVSRKQLILKRKRGQITYNLKTLEKFQCGILQNICSQYF